MAMDDLTGFSRMQNDPVVSKASELLRLGAMPSPDELKNGKVKPIHNDCDTSILTRSL